MLATVAELGTHPETGLAFERLAQTIAFAVEHADRHVENRHLHPAGDVDSDRIGNYAAAGGEHPADRQAITHVGIGHQCARHRDRQGTGVFDLANGRVFEVVPPTAEGGHLFARLIGAPGPRAASRGRRKPCGLTTGQAAPDGIGEKGLRLRHQILHLPANRGFGDSRRFGRGHRLQRQLEQVLLPEAEVDQLLFLQILTPFRLRNALATQPPSIRRV